MKLEIHPHARAHHSNSLASSSCILMVGSTCDYRQKSACLLKERERSFPVHPTNNSLKKYEVYKIMLLLYHSHTPLKFAPKSPTY